jgi:hypothetical protein
MELYFDLKKTTVQESLYAGVVAGLIAGLVMAVAAMFFALLMGQEIWTPLKMVGITIVDDAWIAQTGFYATPVLTGLILYLVFGGVFGAIFSYFGGRLSVASAAGRGIIYGLALWVFMQFILLPIANPTLADTAVFPFALSFVIYGALLGLYPSFLPPYVESQAKEERARRAA